MTYFALKSLHILAVTIFLGNIVTGLFWKAHGDRSNDARIMAHTLNGIIRSDRWFTLPGVAAIIVFGVMTALDRELYVRLSRRWELWGLLAILTPLAALALMVFKTGS